ncbi:acetyltransferase [Mycolicibacterium sp. 018/SC-01/001]|uniref:DUF6640 family protein n=1 Tax=Mycolicibacterium sp. 018/SC-01/001 TaxID=2592069 RepID=UPI00117D985A|nr:DUF6640 family protein [Mycolicibacterium sp. 018/SC-01/001]TRW88731.1 acetyltransferase [Mycolicibacterium sp. 018/SC-01/001]
MKTPHLGKILLTLTATWSAVGSYVFDWNDTHIHNPEWTPHAKFHNAQSMSMGVFLGVPAVRALWGRGPWDRRALDAAALGASGYWLTQLSATAYPGTALFDHARKPRSAPGNAVTQDDSSEPPSGRPPRLCGPQPLISVAALTVNAVAYALERKRLARLR